MPQNVFPIDQTKSMFEQETPGHNRWHPEIPEIATVRPGDDFRMDCREWTDGQIKNSDDANDVRDVDLMRCHVLSGPVYVEGAEPGDVLVVDILDLGPHLPGTAPDELAGASWGYTGIFDKTNGGGFLTDHYPDAHKAIWDFKGIFATSRHVPGVRFAGLSHPGLIGCAPSADLLAEWNRRERALIQTDPDRVPALALPPNPENALLGTLPQSEFDRVAAEACRTVPPREHGGNVDIKNLSRGTRIYFPVYVEGAKLSLGDLHFSQGDGEITFCGAIEMGGFIDLGVDLIKGGVAKYAMTNPIFKPGPVEPRYSEFLMFEGISVEEDGTNRYMDATVAYRRACLNAIEYLKTLGYTGEQAYLLLGAAPVEGRIGGIVDIPNCCATVGIPTEIFDFDVYPSDADLVTRDLGRQASTTG
ncbi:acetamidase/formamidase family protein [Rubrobacter marinus]|uniref:Acetamidase/formamidase family protein n=1 Tax=Rubrobacter marinus TaxID=2653852 RepID=A0A6G8PTC1_9ACTN|nr:formamidase [Rubrobacter marinus]QIN77739.1 acetamidase/formamidase family protein [Rubrobacter marinus]